MKKINLSVKQIASICVVLVAIGISWIAYNSFTFRITDITPDTKNISYINPYFKVIFNKDIQKKGLVVTSSDTNIIRNSEVKDNTLTIILNEMEIGKKYLITIDTVVAKNGKKIHDTVLLFTPNNTPFNNLSDELQQGIINNQSYFTDDQADPILSYLPASSLGYSITPVFTGSNLTLDIKILLSKSDLGSQKESTIEQYKQQALDYIKGIGFDPSKYLVGYTVVEPSLY